MVRRCGQLRLSVLQLIRDSDAVVNALATVYLAGYNVYLAAPLVVVSIIHQHEFKS